MRMGKVLAAGIAIGLVASAPDVASANDTTAELAAGGLVLTRSDGIEMRSEDLFLSEPLVRVRYRFANVTAKELTVFVAFPMPDVTGSVDFMEALPTEDAENLLAFRTSVDGAPVAARVEQKAIANGVDRTAMLRALAVPLAPHLTHTLEVVDRLPRQAQDQLVKAGLVTLDEYDEGKGMERHLQPVWTLKTTYYWSQTFPAGREISVEHQYKPSVGASAGSSLELPELRGPDTMKGYRDFCVEAAFIASVDRVKKQVGVNRQAFWEKRIGYVLSTGGNWRKPIGDFRLVIDKGKPDNLLSVCADGIRKIGATQFEVRRVNYRPDHDLSILILERWTGQ